MSARTLRWYSHAKIKRYGRTLYVTTPRLWKWGLSCIVYTCSTFGLGAIVFRDQDDDEWVLLVCVAVVEFRITRIRYWTRREHREHLDKYAAEHGPQLVDDVEKFLRSDG